MVIAAILNVFIILMELRAFSLSVKEGGWGVFVYYTEISNALCLVSSVLFVIFGQTPSISAVRYLACCMLVFTFFVCLCVLTPLGTDPHMLFFEGHCFYHHLACPVLSVFSYVLFEGHAGKAMVPFAVAVTLAYGITMLILNAAGKIDGPYPFFRVKEQSGKATVLWMIILFIAASALFSGLWAIAH